jgi:hypothetical protein
VDRTGPPPARLPWEQRRRVGRISAWGRTVLLATFAPTRLAAEVQRHVRYPDALRFRLVTSIVAGLMLGAVLFAGTVTYRAAGFFNPLLQYTPESLDQGLPTRLAASANFGIPWEAGISFLPAQPVAAVLFIVLASGMATYWLHPRRLPVERQNAAVALGHYAGAPFLFLPFTLACCAAAMALEASYPRSDVAALFTVLAIVGAVLNTWTMLKSPLMLVHLAARGGAGRVVAAAVLLPVMWAASALAAFTVFPWMVGFVRLVVGSLR